jgi:hypothetical protein
VVVQGKRIRALLQYRNCDNMNRDANDYPGSKRASLGSKGALVTSRRVGSALPSLVSKRIESKGLGAIGRISVVYTWAQGRS